MSSRRVLCLLILVGVFVAVSLEAQEPVEEAIPNWPAPPFWQPAARGASVEVSGDTVGVAQAAAISSPLPFVPVDPCRMLDTRITGGPITSGTERTVTLTGAPCEIPPAAAAVSANFVIFDITGTSSAGVLILFPAGSPSTFQAIINWVPTTGQVANASAVPLGTGGAITVRPQQGAGTVNLVIDVNGYYGGGVIATNTFLGRNAGNFTMTGGTNTGIGASALFSNTTGLANTASGFNALFSNTTGGLNTASGSSALANNTEGNFNTASGVNALAANTTGSSNTASGIQALFSNTTGSGNIAIGRDAGSSLTAGSNNICIGNSGVAGESDTIRIGGGQTRAFIDGIHRPCTSPRGCPLASVTLPW